MYTEVENKVLLHFFTNTDKNVYCATDNMPIAMWALLLGGYSRSAESLRNRLLKVFAEIAEENKITYEDYIAEIAKNISLGGLDLSSELERASKFLVKYAVNYGHNSLKDSCFNMIAIEGVSIKASKILENSKQGAFQEKSTRYMDFSGDVISEYVTHLEGKLLLDKAMELYNTTKNTLIEHYKNKINRNEFKTEEAWIRTCNAKAFDDSRYLLPTSIKTSLGVTMPTRETERWISRLLSNSLKEIVDLGEMIKEECVKITPALIKHVSNNPYLNKRNSKLYEKLTEFDSTIASVPCNGFIGANLVESSDIEYDVLYNILNAVGLFDENHLLNTVSGLKMDEVFEMSLSDRGQYDEMPEETATGLLHFEIVCDIGAFRDIQRHRVGTQVVETWNAFRGYSIPPIFDDEGLETINAQYITIMDRISEFNKTITNQRLVDSEYYLLLGHNVKFSYQCDFKQFAYLVELRSGESGHYSYRKIAQQMYEEVNKKFPSLAKYVRVNMSGYTDRRKAEEVIQEKMEKASLSSVDMSKPTSKY